MAEQDPERHSTTPPTSGPGAPAGTAADPNELRAPFWTDGHPGMDNAMNFYSGGVASDFRDAARPLLFQALREGGVLREINAVPYGAQGRVPAKEVDDFFVARSARLVCDEDATYHYVWRDGVASVVGVEDRSVEVIGAYLATLDEALYAQTVEASKGWHVPRVVPPETHVEVLVREHGGFGRKRLTTERSTLVAENYEPRVVAAFGRSVETLLAPEPAGRLVLLEGAPGTGKTRLVRAMLGALMGNANVLLVPEHLVMHLASPEIISTLMGAASTKPMVLVLEDCDDCLLSRRHVTETGARADVATLSAVLNLADGIIGNALNVRLLATTNARVEHMDEALLRPGRMAERIAVGPLPYERALDVIAREAKMPREAADRFFEDPDEGSFRRSLTLAEAYNIARTIAAQEPSVTPPSAPVATDAQPAAEA